MLVADFNDKLGYRQNGIETATECHVIGERKNKKISCKSGHQSGR